VLRRFAELVGERKDRLVTLLSSEVGKVTPDARLEVGALAGKVQATLDAAAGRVVEPIKADGTIARETREPLGTVAVIGPFNFPLHLPNGWIAPALLAGNRVVFKPSEHAEQCGQALVDLYREAGVPEDVLSIQTGGREVVEELADDPRIDGVLFTGGLVAGRALHERMPFHKMLALELGGNNAVIVDATTDVAAAVKLVTDSAYVLAGQRCTCARRLIVTDAAPATFLEQLTEAVRALRVDRPAADPPPDLAHVITPAAAEAVLAAQDSWQRQGGRVIVPVRRLPLGDRYVSPGLVDTTGVDVPDEEVFGPLLQVVRVPDLDAAIAEANRTRFGLAASLVADDRVAWQQFRREVRCGCVNWNRPTVGASGRVAFGGWGESGNHRPAGAWAFDQVTRPKVSLEPADA
jgi:succinylglutamic semialdehyde dehydrogenase